jgi:hypothetical protein
MRMLSCLEKMLKEKKGSWSRQTSMLVLFKSPSGTPALPPVMVNSGDDDKDDPPTLQEEVSPL